MYLIFSFVLYRYKYCNVFHFSIKELLILKSFIHNTKHDSFGQLDHFGKINSFFKPLKRVKEKVTKIFY